MKVTEAQIRASRKNEAKNPERTVFNSIKRSAFSFARGGKENRFVKFDKDMYRESLVELRELVDNKIEEIDNM